MSVKTVQIEDKIYCESVAKSISDILRFSLDDEFRRNTFELFGVSSTKETEKEINKRLLSIIQNETAIDSDKILRKRNKNLIHEKDKENLQRYRDTLNEEQGSQTSSTNSGSQSIFKNIFQKNWLQISSQQYRDIIKRRKSNYFSQPQFGHSHQRYIHNFSLSISNSQPTFSMQASNLLFNEGGNPSLELSDDGINYCHKRFKDSFEENAKKYFKKNLKSDRRLSF